ncbi:MAG: sulfatase [Magnetococcales bacterium]|nr:sulfatase [Magnetococcales bacterium]
MKPFFLVAALLTAWLLWMMTHPTGPPIPAHANLLLITLDTTRADHLTPYGYPRETSPTLARLAEEGFLFEQARSVASNTSPNHATLFTGRYPGEHGVVENGIPLSAQNHTLAETLQDHGYQTAAFTGFVAVGPESGMEQGFDTFEYHPVASHQHRADTTEENSRGFEAALAWLKGWQAGVGEGGRAGSGEKNQQPQSHPPFFLWYHAQHIHESYDPPPPYDTLFMAVPRTRGVPGMDDFNVRCSNDIYRASKNHLLPPQREEEIIALYDGEIRLVDDLLARMVVQLQKMGVYEQTAILIVADHGEQLFEPSWNNPRLRSIGHNGRYNEEVLSIPLIIKPQSGIHLPTGRKIPHPVSTVDLLPTLLELLELPVSAELSGRSLVSMMYDPSKPPLPEPVQYIQERVGDRLYQGVVRDGWKLIRTRWDSGESRRHLFRLTGREGEPSNLADRFAGVVQHLEAGLDQWLAGQTVVEEGEGERGEVSRAMQKALRDAGYLR